VDFAVPAVGLLAEEQRPHYLCPRLLRTHVEVLALDIGDDFQIFDEVVRLVLRVELGLVEVPGLREVVQFTQSR